MNAYEKAISLNLPGDDAAKAGIQDGTLTTEAAVTAVLEA